MCTTADHQAWEAHLHVAAGGMTPWDHYSTFYLPHSAGSNADSAWNAVPDVEERSRFASWTSLSLEDRWVAFSGEMWCWQPLLSWHFPSTRNRSFDFPLLLTAVLSPQLSVLILKRRQLLDFFSLRLLHLPLGADLLSFLRSRLTWFSAFVFSVYQRQMMLSYLLLLLLHVCSLE